MEDILYDFYQIFGDPTLVRDLYRYSMLINLTLGLVLIPAFLALAFYKFIDHPKFQALRHWLFIMFISTLSVFGCFIITFIVLKNDKIPIAVGQEGTLFAQSTSVFAIFSLEVALLSALWYFIISLPLKLWSTNCSTTPF